MESSKPMEDIVPAKEEEKKKEQKKEKKKEKNIYGGKDRGMTDNRV